MTEPLDLGADNVSVSYAPASAPAMAPTGEPTLPQPAAADAGEQLPRRRSPWWMAWRRFRSNRAALVSGVVLMVIIVSCTIASTLPESRPLPTDYRHPQGLLHPWPPSGDHYFGTDPNGHDLFLRVLQGGAVSLQVGFVAAAIAVFIGTFYGAISGLAGGRLDRWMMRVVDVLYGLPYIILIILLLVVMNRSFVALFVAIGAFIWLTMARIVRGQVLRLREEDFVLSARSLGANWPRLLVRHMLPNLVGPIIVCATLTMPVAILQESFISFLGLGPHMTSWGQLASEGVRALNPAVAYWWLVLFPSAMLALTLLCLNFLGDGLRDALDPRMPRQG